MNYDLDSLVEKHAWVRSHFKAQVRSGRTRSLKRGLKYQVSAEFLAELAERQDFRCAVSKIEFRSPGINGRDPFSPSVDRIDNTRGYEVDNVRIVCLIVNLARNNFGDEAVFEMARAIASLPQ